MVTVSVCVGSSCHLKGAYELIRLCEETIAETGMRDRVNLKGTFCLGKCSEEGVTLNIDGEIITGVSPDNFMDVFKKNVLRKVRKE